MQNSTWVIIDIIIYEIIAFLPFIFIKYKRGNFKFVDKKYKRLWLLFFYLLIFYCVFDKTGGDYFHYFDIVEGIYKSQRNESHLEYPYLVLSKIIGNCYSLWRLIIWGCSLLLLVNLLKKLNIDYLYGIWIFSLVALMTFSTGRVSLAIVLCLQGLWICLRSNNITTKIFGIIIIIASIFFHKSIFILLIVLLLSLFPISLTSLIASIICIPIIIWLIRNNLYSLVLIISNDSSSLEYFSKERIGMGLGELINVILIWIPLIFYVVSKFKYYNNCNDRFIKCLYKVVLFLLYISIIFYLLNFGSSAIPTRIRNMTLIPLSLIILYKIRDKRFNRYFMILFVLLLIGNNYQLMYLYYLKSIGLGV